MAPPPVRTKPDAPADAGRKEALVGHEHEQEHGKSKRCDKCGGHKTVDGAEPQIDIIEVDSSSDSDAKSFEKRSPEPEARQPLGGAELQRPPKFFHEDNGMKGMTPPLPKSELPPAESTSKNADTSGAPDIGKQEIEDQRGFLGIKHPKRSDKTTKTLKAGALDREEGLPGVQDDLQHHHADEGTIGVKDNGGFGPPQNNWWAETHETFSKALRVDRLPDKKIGFFKEGTIGSIPMDDNSCYGGNGVAYKRDGTACDGSEGTVGSIRMDDTVTTVTKRNEVKGKGYAVNTEGYEVTNNDWGSAIHGAVAWAFQNKLKGAQHNVPGIEGLPFVPASGDVEIIDGHAVYSPSQEDEIVDEAAIEAEAEELVMAYFEQHPDEKAKVMEGLAEMAQEQKDLGNTIDMGELIQQGADAAELNASSAHLAKRGLRNLITEKGKGKHHFHPASLDPTKDEGLPMVQDGGHAEPIDQEEAATNWAEHEAFLKGAVKPQPETKDKDTGVAKPETPAEEAGRPQGITFGEPYPGTDNPGTGSDEEPAVDGERHHSVDHNEWTKGLPEQHSGPLIDLHEAAEQATADANLHQDRPKDHSGGLFKEGTIGSIPLDNTPCREEMQHCTPETNYNDEPCQGEKCQIMKADGEGNIVAENNHKRAPIDPIVRPCIIKHGVRSGNCGGDFGAGKQSLDGYSEQNEKRGIGKFINENGKGKHHYHPEDEHVPEEGLHSVPDHGFSEPIPLEEAHKQAAADEALRRDAKVPHIEDTSAIHALPPAKNGPPVDLHEAAEQAIGDLNLSQSRPKDHSGGLFREGTIGSIPMDDTACHEEEHGCDPRENYNHKRAAVEFIPKSGWIDKYGKGKHHYHPENEHVEEGLHEVKDGGEAEPIPVEEAEKQAAADEALLQSQMQEPTVQGSEWVKGIDMHDESDGVPEQPRRQAPAPPNTPSFEKRGNTASNAANNGVSKHGKGKHHYHPEPLDPTKDEGLPMVKDGGFSEPVDQEEAARNWAANESLLRGAVKPQPDAEDENSKESEAAVGDGQNSQSDSDGESHHSVQSQDDHNRDGSNEPNDVVHADWTKGLPEQRSGPEIDLHEAAEQAEAERNLRQDRPNDHSVGLFKEGTIGSIPMDDTPCRGVEVHNCVPETSYNDKRSPTDDEDCQGDEACLLMQNVENDGSVVPNHAKRAPFDPEDWRADGQDEIDVKFSQRLGAEGKGKHHKSGKHHKVDKHHSKDHHTSVHHQTSTVHHSKDHHATSTMHTVSYSTPPKAPGHELPSSRSGGYKFTQTNAIISGTPSAVPTASVPVGTALAHAANPTQIVAPSKHTGTVARPSAKNAASSHAAKADAPLPSGYPLKDHKGHVESFAASESHAAAAQTTAVSASSRKSPHREYEPIANHREPIMDDDYRAFDNFNAATLNSVTPDSSTAQLLAESERMASDLKRPSKKPASSHSGSKFGKRAWSQVDEKYPSKYKNPGDVLAKDYFGHGERKNLKHKNEIQEERMYGIVEQQAPVITAEEYAAIAAANGVEAAPTPRKWGHISRAWSYTIKKLKGQPEVGEREDFRKYVVPQNGNGEPKAKVWDPAHEFKVGVPVVIEVTETTASDKPSHQENINKLGKRHSHIPSIKEEEDAKMRGYANSRHLSGSSAKKDRQKAAESVKDIAKDLKGDRVAAAEAAEIRAEKMMEKAEKKANKKIMHGDREWGWQDHDTYDPIAAHDKEDEEEAWEEDLREGAWTDVKDGELVDDSRHNRAKQFPAYGGIAQAAATGIPNAIGNGIAKGKEEMGDVGLMIVIGAWIAMIYIILKIARRRTEGQTGWLKGRRPAARTDGAYLEDMEEGGMEKRYD